MRRQVKPFVTEYRGNARRSRDLPKDFGEHSELSGAPADRERQGAGQRAFPSEPPEDSYEAAMRAADALFAPAPRRHDPPPPSAPEPAAETSEPAPSSDTPPSAVWPVPDEARGASPEPPRRILQAIEPSGDDRFAALEAERAPKRRGRKPGSKNKPKIVVSDDWAAEAPRDLQGAASLRETAEAEATMEALDADPVDARDLEVLPADGAALPLHRGRSERYGWKRSGLRPGERWKRRLPKVAW